MSRCLPFSPEALSKRRSSHEALNKLQKDKEEINTLRRREKDLKKNMKKHGDYKAEKRHKRPSKQAMMSRGVFDDQYAQMAMSDDSISGKSDITEEYGLPTYSTRIGNIPDRTDNTFTNKRKRQEESTNGVESKKVILRFRLPLKKHSAQDASLTEPAKNPSSAVEVEVEQIVKKPLTKQPGNKNVQVDKNKNVQVEKNKNVQVEKNKNVQIEAEKPFTICLEKNKDVEVEPEKLFTRCLEKNAEEAERPSTVDAKKHKSRCSKRSSTYKMLIEDWAPPSIDQLTKQLIDEEDDWLFGSRKKQEHDNGDRDPEYCLSTGLWPQATHFPELDIYALPYTILF